MNQIHILFPVSASLTFWVHPHLWSCIIFFLDSADSIFDQNEGLKYHARPLNILKLGLALGSHIIIHNYCTTTPENPGIHKAQPACFANLARRLQPHPVPHNLEGILCCRIHGVCGSECSSVGDHRKFGRFRFCHAKMRLLKRQAPQGTMALHCSGIKWGGFLDEIQRAWNQFGATKSDI